MNHEYEMIVPICLADVPVLKRSIDYIQRYLKAKRIVIIGNIEVANALTEVLEPERIVFLNEDELTPALNFSRIRELLRNRAEQAEGRTGWYFQQFIKMAYCFKSQTEFYLSWDADTIPLREIDFFDSDNHAIFDTKSEFHEPYFFTIRSLLDLDPKLQ